MRRERAIKKVYFRAGQPTLVQSSMAREGLLRALFEQNRLDLDRLTAMVSAQPPTGLLADWLVANGLVSADVLRSTQQQRSRSMLIDALQWHEGSYVFLFDRQPDAELASGESPGPLKKVVVDALAGECDEEWLWRYFRERLDRRPALMAEARHIEEALALNSLRSRLIRLIDGENNIERIVLGSGLRPVDAFRILWAMEAFGLLSYPKRTDAEREERDEPAVELGVEAMNLIQRLQSRGEELLRLPVFEMLGIGRVFTEEELRRGYYTIAQNYHQKDYVDKLPTEWRKLSYAIFERASNAFEALVVWAKKNQSGDFASFLELDESLLARREYPAPLAEVSFLRGVVAVREGRVADALDLFADARSLEPTESDYRAWHAWATILAGELNKDELARTALVELRKVAAENSYSVTAQELCARGHEQLGRTEEAHEYFARAERLAPDDPTRRADRLRTQKRLTAEDLDATATESSRDPDRENEMREALVRMQSADYFTVLGVERDASIEEIRRKYFALAKDYHPDRFKDSRLLAPAEQIFVIINEAYEVLSNDRKRRAYERSLRQLDAQRSMQQREQKFSTERVLQKGKALLQRNEWDAACRLFEQQMQLDDTEDWRFRVYLAWARYNRDHRRDPTAERQMEAVFKAALDADPGFTDVYLLQGKHYRRAELWLKAKARFEKVLELEPGHMEAMRELRLINQRLANEPKPKEVAEKKPEKAAAEGKGIFRSLFGRKPE